MNTNTTCPTSTCDTKIAELPRYYPRQLITPDDLTLEQNYFRDRLRRHNRLLHGWGVVCGALVCPIPNPAPTDGTNLFVSWQVKVEPGYILGPYGDEIIIDCPRTVDLRTNGTTGVTGDPCVEPVDPWCNQVFTPPTSSTLYIAVKYRQCMTRPVRVQPAGCGCNDSSCEYSRWHDGYEIGVLQQCPPCSSDPPTVGYDPGTTTPDLELLAQGETPACPDCACGPWVGLASVTLNSDGSIKSINNCDCRRLVISFSQFWWMCHGRKPEFDSVNPTSVAADGNDAQIIVSGKYFHCGVKVSLGQDIAVKQTLLQDSQTLKVTVNVPTSIPVGSTRDVVISNMDGSQVTGAITISKASPVPKPVPPPTTRRTR